MRLRRRGVIRGAPDARRAAAWPPSDNRTGLSSAGYRTVNATVLATPVDAPSGVSVRR
jgi:hypothetical protein